jgi:hypothetical protein
MSGWAPVAFAETSHCVELPHALRVFSFRLVQSFQDNHLTSRDGSSASRRTDTSGIVFPFP